VKLARVELALAAGLESVLVLVAYALPGKWLFVMFVTLPGGIVSLLLSGNVHDDEYMWIGVVVSWVF